ncbi:MAG: phosphatidate cytidylyltransferase [Candidatus Melainabacteria bacterium]|nr:MAG: phosphatidate cytidylyltransferase [Candidatus Melainabacteria bacterium]
MNLELNKNAIRMLTGFIVGLVVLGGLYYGGIFLFLVLAMCVFSGSKEYVNILKNKGFFPSLKVILITDLILAILFYLNKPDLILAALTLCTIASFMWVLFKGRQPYIANAATTVLGFIYGGWLTLHLLLLRGLSSTSGDGVLDLTVGNSEGLGFTVFMFVIVLLTDTGCYFVGRRFGKHSLAPTVSPKKTIEGALGGIVCALIGGFIAGFCISLPWYHSLILGLLCTLFAQIGDLCESLIKRDAGVKDSSDILPGHGGFLDRTDSYVFTIPVAYYYIKFFILDSSINVQTVLEGLMHGFGL